ncbi:hypothetical protein KN63_04510, partial [Smithella sp. F21]
NGEALWEIPTSIKEDKEFFYQVALTFWQSTEAIFYHTMFLLKDCIESGKESLGIKMAWHRNLCESADNIFVSNVMNNSIEDTDPKRVVIARSELGRYNRGKKIKELLGMPVEKSKSDKKIRSKKEKKQSKQE